MKILLIGKTGQLGGQLLPLLEKAHTVLAPGREEFDLQRCEEIIGFVRSSTPDLVINTAAFHNVILCEQEWAQAFAINSAAVGILAEAAAEVDARFLTFSTDYVFDGAKRAPYLESDLPGPLQVYGTSKLGGELLARARHPEGSYVIRTCGVYGSRGARQKNGNFIEQRILEARGHDVLEVGSDQVVSPTYAVDLAQAVAALIEKGNAWRPGIYHLVNEGHCTWHEFAAEAFRLLGLATKVKAVDRGGRSGKMRRPLFSALANKKAAELEVVLPHWRDSLARYIVERAKA